ncbi:MAG: hypothetical protein AAFR27_11910, partial [Pseudomonadota bacterium]
MVSEAVLMVFITQMYKRANWQVAEHSAIAVWAPIITGLSKRFTRSEKDNQLPMVYKLNADST